MSIESNLKNLADNTGRIADALEDIAQALTHPQVTVSASDRELPFDPDTTDAPEPTGDTQAPEPTAGDSIAEMTLEEINNELIAIAGRMGDNGTAILNLMKEAGYTQLSEASPEMQQHILREARKL